MLSITDFMNSRVSKLEKPYTALAIAVGSGKIGYVFMVDDELCDWSLSLQSSKSTTAAQSKVRSWIRFYSPNVVVTEQLTLHSRKRGQTLKNIMAIEEAVQASGIQLVQTERIQRHTNKYEEMAALTQRYPTISEWAPPKRKLWEAEHKNTILFEALSLIDNVI